MSSLPQSGAAAAAAAAPQQQQQALAPEPTPARRLSTQGGLFIGQKIRSGTPQLHHFLQQQQQQIYPVEWEKPRASMSGLPGARVDGARRHSSAGLVLYTVKASESDAEQKGKEMAGDRLMDRSQTSYRPTLSVSTASRLSSPTKISNPTPIEESAEENAEAVEENVRVGMTAPSYAESEPPLGKTSVPASPSTEPVSSMPSNSWNGDAGALRAPSPMTGTFSSASSVTSNSPSDASSDETADTAATSPERAPEGDETPIARVAVDIDKTFKRASREPPRGRRRARTTTGSSDHADRHSNPYADRYGTPEMPRGTAKLPHIPAGGLTPRIHTHGHPKHLPRAEKLPMSGYELLASAISSSSSTPNNLSALLGSQHRFASRRSSVTSFVTSTSSVRSGPEELDAAEAQHASLKPIYRRFEALNHRVLLHMQDELSELEEQLHRLDTTDTQTRRAQSRILPASRRAEHLAGGELQWHKTDVLSKIGYKLGQYNHVLSSFSATRDLPAPSMSDVHDYRSYLATHQPITETETRFLDTVDDLVTLAATKKKDAIANDPPPSATHANGRLTPSVAQEYLDTFRPQEEDAVPPFPTVTPIPGTMHGNSWLARHNRLSSSSGRGHSRTKSHPIALPQFVHRRPSTSSSSQQPHRQRLSPAITTPRPLPSPLRDEETLHHHQTAEPKAPIQGHVKSAAVNSSENAHVVLHLTIAMAVAVLIPILAFSAVPGFVGRLTVVLLVGLSAMGSVVQSGVIKKGVDSSTDMMYITAVYAAVMAVVAGVIS